jgi:hypothetical protein
MKNILQIPPSSEFDGVIARTSLWVMEEWLKDNVKSRYYSVIELNLIYKKLMDRFITLSWCLSVGLMGVAMSVMLREQVPLQFFGGALFASLLSAVLVLITEVRIYWLRRILCRFQATFY